MEKEFVTHEQSIALKELGFDEPCLAHFTKYSKNGTPHLVVWEDYSKHQDVNEMSGYGECLAPLKQQVFKFFREKYDLDSYISKQLPNIGSKFSDGRFAYSVVINVMYYPFLTKASYEEAENACIDKLIEIVKTYES